VQALVKYGPGSGNVEVREVPVPEPGPGQVRIRVEAAGICGSDLHIYHGNIKFEVRPPVIMGHEFAGRIDRLGPGVEGLEPGMAVVSETAAYICGVCEQCRHGSYNLCPERLIIGYVYDGCFARYVCVDAERVHRLPPQVSTLAGALCEPLAVVVHAVLEQGRVQAAETVAVTGPGAIGLLTAQVAAAAGATVVLCGTGADASRLALARELGIEHALNVESDDVQGTLAELTGGRGADVFFECAGAQPAAQMGLSLVKRGGRYVQVGLFGKPVSVDLELLAYKEIQATGAISSHRESWEKMLYLLGTGRVRTEPLISHRFALQDWREAFRVFEAREGVKLVFVPE
jgi:L-iditol 2-dehydrogenase